MYYLVLYAPFKTTLAIRTPFATRKEAELQRELEPDLYQAFVVETQEEIPGNAIWIPLDDS